MNIYLEAAIVLDTMSHKYSCWAINKVCVEDSPNPYTDEYHARWKYYDYFSPYTSDDGRVHGQSWWGHPNNEKNILARQLALLFMHEIDKDEKEN